MNIFKKELFGQIEAYLLGFGPIGPPLMSVYLYIADGAVIDTGQRHMRKAVMNLLEGKKPSCILLTHHHEDHSGNASVISKTHHLKVIGHPITVEKMRKGFGIFPYQHYVWGKSKTVEMVPYGSFIETDRFRFKPIHTPGHSKDHTVYLEEKNGWLFSGDLYLGDRIKFFRSDERIRDQIDSLKKVLRLDFESLFCGHRPCPQHGKIRLEKKLAFLEDFYGDVRMLREKGYSERAIIKKLANGEDRKVKWVTMGNASFANMVRSAIRAASK